MQYLYRNIAFQIYDGFKYSVLPSILRTVMNNKKSVLFILFCLLLFTVNGGDAVNANIGGQLDAEFTKIKDIWSSIIGRRYLDKRSLSRLLRTNTMFHEIGEDTHILEIMMQNEIKKSIHHLQHCNYSLFDDFEIKKTPSDQLMKQYLYGFDCELLYFLDAVERPSLNRNRLKIKEKILNINKLLKEYKIKYGVLRPMHISDGFNASSAEMVKFCKFMSIQIECERLMSEFEEMMRSNDRNKDYDLTFFIANIKLMMQQIGSNIGYPGISRVDFKLMSIKYYWRQNQEHFIERKRCIGASPTDIYYARFSLPVMHIPGYSALCDRIITFLDKVYDELLVTIE